MKKNLLSLFLLLPLCCFAQKGMQGVGVSFSIGTDLLYSDWTSSYRTIYQNHLTDRFRISASLDLHNYRTLDYRYLWGRVNENGDRLDNTYLGGNTYLAGVEGHYFVNEVRRLRPYVIGGILIGAFKTEDFYYYENMEDWEKSVDKQYWDSQGFAGGVKLGVGLNYRIRYDLTAQLEVPFYIIWYNPLFAPCFNLVYTF